MFVIKSRIYHNPNEKRTLTRSFAVWHEVATFEEASRHSRSVLGWDCPLPLFTNRPRMPDSLDRAGFLLVED
jgi:hypothetical protein